MLFTATILFYSVSGECEDYYANSRSQSHSNSDDEEDDDEEDDDEEDDDDEVSNCF